MVYDANMNSPNLTTIPQALAHPARSAMLLLLMNGQAMTATELANHAGITRQTTSTHIAHLLEAGLIRVVTQGRHKYIQLASRDIATLIEQLLVLDAQRRGEADYSPPKSTIIFGPKDPNLRFARVCYDHLAGELGGWCYQIMLDHEWVSEVEHRIEITEIGNAKLHQLGAMHIRPQESTKTPRHLTSGLRPCMDWSERRTHLSGTIAASMLQRWLELGWCTRVMHSRELCFNKTGLAQLKQWLDV